MNLDFKLIEDKVEFFEALDIRELEKKINEKVDQNRAIMLGVHSVSHQMHVDGDGRRFYSAVVHFRMVGR
ncbi:YrzA family protein [Bacillus tianshenii]|uniref:DUF2536 family protein n=1 Tax=Sutcliffiella tianshenii TaxID=1463404 RepID=UPI001CD518C6|nr:DUF2536 family protein [Bacillus tianshenii]MCA1318841.1 YrzA family protein [Bacillus tianshenii]